MCFLFFPWKTFLAEIVPYYQLLSRLFWSIISLFLILFRKRGTRLKITIPSSKFEKVLDNKAEKCRNISKNLSKSKLRSSKKVKKVDDNRSRFERKIDFGGEAFFRICGEEGGWLFFESSYF